MDALLDFSTQFNVQLLDSTVTAFFNGSGEGQRAAQKIIAQFQEHPDAWLRVDAILENSLNPNSRFLALQILDRLVTTRWNALPREQCDGIKGYVVSLIIKTSSDSSQKVDRSFLNKLNLVLVHVLKHEWPKSWPNFISELVGASRSSISLCENNMVILKLLSEEVFDFSAEQMTTVKAKNLKVQLCGEFSEVFQLCLEILEKANKPSLIQVTLDALLRFLKWIPLGYIFETTLVNTLVSKFFPNQAYRTSTLACLTEIAGLDVGEEYLGSIKLIFESVLKTLASILPYDDTLDLNHHYLSSGDGEQRFLYNLALFFCSCLAHHFDYVLASVAREHILLAHFYLLKLSLIDDRELFKVCLEYWNKLVVKLFNERNPLLQTQQPTASVFCDVMSNLRVVLIDRMVKPEEVLIVEDENGEIVRESVKETDTIVLHKSIRDVLIYLANLDLIDTENVMTEKLNRQIDGSEWSWSGISRLCWAIGSISGTMNEELEKKFLVQVIRELLGLVEIKKGKDNKAVVASNIMYIVGQYPRFLKAHWRFLKTVVNKLFEFMHELHEGVQDMACDTFIKIAKKCRRHFVIIQAGESLPFVEEILAKMPSIVCDLNPSQVMTFFEAVGSMIEAHTSSEHIQRDIQSLMIMPNQSWNAIIAAATAESGILNDIDTLKSIGSVIRTNQAAMSSVGFLFFTFQVSATAMDMLSLYRTLSEKISLAVRTEVKSANVRAMRAVKREILKLFSLAILSVPEKELASFRCQYIPKILESILLDYKNNEPQAREAEVLSMTASVFEQFKEGESGMFVKPVVDSVFEVTLEMINKDFSEYPEHRAAFFGLLQALTSHCFLSLIALDTRMFKLYYDSIVWAFKHNHRDISDKGLGICSTLLESIDNVDPRHAQAFYSQYYIPLLQDLLYVLTDSDHYSSFKQQCKILSHLLSSASQRDAVWRLQSSISNEQFLREFLRTILTTAFPHLQGIQVTTFIRGLFDLKQAPQDIFKAHVRDFLISLKEYSEQENSELYREEMELEQERKLQAEREAAMKVPGLLKPSEAEESD